MKVGRRMRRTLITIQKRDPVEAAQALMAVNNIRHLPVLEGDRLVGIISDRDIREVMAPQQVVTGNGGVRTVYYLPADRTVEESMTANPLRVTPATEIEEAASLLYTNKIGCLPVVEEEERVVGIITETDILRVFTEIMGVLETSSRIDIALGSDPRAMETATEIIRRNGGEVISVGVAPPVDGKQRYFHFRLKSCRTGPIAGALRAAGFPVRDEVG